MHTHTDIPTPGSRYQCSLEQVSPGNHSQASPRPSGNEETNCIASIPCEGICIGYNYKQDQIVEAVNKKEN